MPGAVITQPEPAFVTGDDFCAYLEGFDSSRFWSEMSMPPTRDIVDADTARNRGKRQITAKQSLALSAAGFRDYEDASGLTPYMDSLFNSGERTQIMLFPATDEPSGIYGWAGSFFLTEQEGPAAVGGANSVSVSGTSPSERSLVRSLQPLREFVDTDFPVDGDIVNNPAFLGDLVGEPTNFGGKGFLQIMALDVTGVADVDIEIAHSTDAFAADDNTLIDFGTFGDTAGNVGGKQAPDPTLLADDVLVNKDLRVKVIKTGVGTIDKLQFVVGFFRALSLVKP